MMVEVVFFVRRTCSQERADEALNYPCTPERAIFSGATFLPSLLYYSTPIGKILLLLSVCLALQMMFIYLRQLPVANLRGPGIVRSTYRKRHFKVCVRVHVSFSCPIYSSLRGPP